jgi:hypothetical protein
MDDKRISTRSHFILRLKQRHQIAMSLEYYTFFNETLIKCEPIYTNKDISVHRTIILDVFKGIKKHVRILFNEELLLAVTCIPKGVSWLEFMHLRSFPHDLKEPFKLV